MDKAKIFMNGKSQAVRLPKKYRFDSDEVLIKEHPMGIILIDPNKQWDQLEKLVGKMSDDFMKDGRDQGHWTEREEL